LKEVPCSDELPYIYRSQAKSGTCSFYAYATLYILKKNKRITLAIRGVRWLDTSVAILTYLLAELSALKIKIKTLYLDRGFFSVPVIRWLKALKIPFIMPAIRCLSFLLVNIWVNLLWRRISQPRRGGRLIYR
jgi:putative transposase